MNRLQPIRKLGEGATAEVHLARDTRTHGCVVLEVLRRELQGQPQVVHDFLRAGRQRRALEHPNVAHRVAEGATVDGRPFLFTEPVPDRTLRGWLRERGPLEWEEAPAILLPLASAVDFLHEQGLVLNGLSSRSVFVESDREAARPKLFDASLSLMRHGALTEPPRDCALLEPEYMAPERILGNRADPRSDVYALGVLFFEIFSGIHPFSGSSRHAIYRHHLGSPAPLLPPGAGPYAAVVERCLAKEPEQRFATTRALLEALDACRGPGGGPIRVVRGAQLSAIGAAPRRSLKRMAMAAASSALLRASVWVVPHDAARPPAPAGLVERLDAVPLPGPRGTPAATATHEVPGPSLRATRSPAEPVIIEEPWIHIRAAPASGPPRERRPAKKAVRPLRPRPGGRAGRRQPRSGR